MSLDRFIYWQDKKPTDEQLLHVVEDFMGGVGEIDDNYQKDGHPWWIVLLPGSPSHPLSRIYPEMMQYQPPPGVDRCLEVCVADDCVDIITRQADDFTNALAEGLAEVMCRAWGGRRSE